MELSLKYTNFSPVPPRIRTNLPDLRKTTELSKIERRERANQSLDQESRARPSKCLLHCERKVLRLRVASGRSGHNKRVRPLRRADCCSAALWIRTSSSTRGKRWSKQSQQASFRMPMLRAPFIRGWKGAVPEGIGRVKPPLGPATKILPCESKAKPATDVIPGTYVENKSVFPLGSNF